MVRFFEQNQRYTQRDLVESIQRRDINQFQRILAVRDVNGVPLVDINNMRNVCGNHHVITVLHAIWQNFRITPYTQARCDLFAQFFESALSVVDNQGCPVVDVNVIDSIGRTILRRTFFHTVNDDNFHALQIRLLQDLLDLRDGQGNLVVDVTRDQHQEPPLVIAACISNHHDVLAILLDIRDVQGHRIFDPSHIYHHPVFGEYTLLDLQGNKPLRDAYRGYARTVGLDANTVAVIRQAGGLTANEVTAAMRHAQAQRARAVHQRVDDNGDGRRQPLAVAATPVRVVLAADDAVPAARTVPVHNNQQMQQAAAAFNQNSQNSHSEEIRVTCQHSLAKLKKRYGLAGVEQHFLALCQFVEALPDTDRRKHSAIAATQRFREQLGKHSRTGLNLKEVVSLVWQGANDRSPSSWPSELKSINDGYVALRKDSLVDKLHQSQTEYGANGPSCLEGTMHMLTSAINKAHTDVVLVFGRDNVATAALEFGLSKAKQYFRALPVAEQRTLLHDWDNIGGAADAYRNKLKKLIKNDLASVFGNVILPINKQDDVLYCIDEISEVIAHDELPGALQSIDAIERACRKIPPSPVITKLVSYRKALFIDVDLTVADEYLLLRRAFRGAYDQFVSQVQNLSEDNDRQVANLIRNFKRDVLAIDAENDKSLDARFVQCVQAYKHFHQLKTRAERPYRQFLPDALAHSRLDSILADYLDRYGLLVLANTTAPLSDQLAYFDDINEDYFAPLFSVCERALTVTKADQANGEVGQIAAEKLVLVVVRLIESSSLRSGELVRVITAEWPCWETINQTLAEFNTYCARFPATCGVFQCKFLNEVATTLQAMAPPESITVVHEKLVAEIRQFKRTMMDIPQIQADHAGASQFTLVEAERSGLRDALAQLLNDSDISFAAVQSLVAELGNAQLIVQATESALSKLRDLLTLYQASVYYDVIKQQLTNILDDDVTRQQDYPTYWQRISAVYNKLLSFMHIADMMRPLFKQILAAEHQGPKALSRLDNLQGALLTLLLDLGQDEKSTIQCAKILDNLLAKQRRATSKSRVGIFSRKFRPVAGGAAAAATAPAGPLHG